MILDLVASHAVTHILNSCDVMLFPILKSPISIVYALLLSDSSLYAQETFISRKAMWFLINYYVYT